MKQFLILEFLFRNNLFLIHNCKFFFNLTLFRIPLLIKAFLSQIGLIIFCWFSIKKIISNYFRIISFFLYRIQLYIGLCLVFYEFDEIIISFIPFFQLLVVIFFILNFSISFNSRIINLKETLLVLFQIFKFAFSFLHESF